MKKEFLDSNRYRDVIIHSTLDSGEDLLLNDKWKKKYHFKIATLIVPTGLVAEAIEVKKNISEEGYYFTMLFDFDTDTEEAKAQLRKKIKRGINRRHLKKREGKWKISSKQILRGRIIWNDDFEDTAYDRVFNIDGKRITIENFAQMFEEYEGWNFELKILDPTDERT